VGIANEEDSETWVLAPSASVVNVRSMWTWIYPFIAFDDLPFYNLFDTMNTALDWSSPLSINHGCAKPKRSNTQHKNVTFRDIFLGSPNSSIIEQHNLALSSQVNNTGGTFSLKYLFNDPGARRGQIPLCVNIIDWVRGLWLAPMIIPTNTSRWQLPECSMINSDRQTSSRGFPHFGRLSPSSPPQTMWKLCEILSRGKH